MNKKTFISSILLGVAATTALSTSAIAADKKMEKCYGVVKAGKNDCASKDGASSCAGQAKINGDKNEWILLPKGACERIVGGSLS